MVDKTVHLPAEPEEVSSRPADSYHQYTEPSTPQDSSSKATPELGADQAHAETENPDPKSDPTRVADKATDSAFSQNPPQKVEAASVVADFHPDPETEIPDPDLKTFAFPEVEMKSDVYNLKHAHLMREVRDTKRKLRDRSYVSETERPNLELNVDRRQQIQVKPWFCFQHFFRPSGAVSRDGFMELCTCPPCRGHHPHPHPGPSRDGARPLR